MPTPHYQNSEIKIFKIIAGPYDNNAYLLVCKKTNHSILIDAPAEPNEIIKLVKTTKLQMIIITHSHLDHIAGLDQIQSFFNAPVAICKPDSLQLKILQGLKFIVFSHGPQRITICFAIFDTSPPQPHRQRFLNFGLALLWG